MPKLQRPPSRLYRNRKGELIFEFHWRRRARYFSFKRMWFKEAAWREGFPQAWIDRMIAHYGPPPLGTIRRRGGP